MIGILLIILLYVAYLLITNLDDVKRFLRLRSRAQQNFVGLPGPPTLPIVGCAHQFSWDNIAFSLQLFEWNKLYMKDGLCATWLGPVPLGVVAKGHTIKPILESSQLIAKPARPGYAFITKWIGEGLLTSGGSKWFGRRKLLTPTFHFSVLQGYHRIFAEQAKVFVDQLEKESDTKQVFDIFPYFKRCALDVICETAMGTELQSQLGGNMEYVRNVTRISEIIWKHERLPWLWIPAIWYLSGYGWEFQKLVKETSDFTRKAFLDLLLDMQQMQQLTDEDIREEVDTFMFEGHDTTASGMGFCVWFLGNNPQYQQKVHEEMDAIFGDSDRAPTPDDLKECVYLEKCIKEALRLCPSVPIIGRQLTNDVKIGETTLPEGLLVIVGIFASHRDPAAFERPDEFYPDHLDIDQIKNRNPYAYVPFSAGPRNCIAPEISYFSVGPPYYSFLGQKFALQEEKAVLSWFFRRYKVESTDRIDTNPPVAELILKPSQGFKVRIEKRVHSRA